MAKIDFTRVETSINEAINLRFIQDLNELAAIANLTHLELAQKTNSETVKKLISRFQMDLKRIKANDPHFFSTLSLSPEQEKRFFEENPVLSPKDWEYIKELKEKIDVWKKKLKKTTRGPSKDKTEEDVKNIETMRKKQKDARLNVNPKWKPL